MRSKHTVWLNAEFLIVAVINKLTAGLELNNAVWFCCRCSVYFIILNCAYWLGIAPFIFFLRFAFLSVVTLIDEYRTKWSLVNGMVKNSYCVSHSHKTHCVRTLCVSFKRMHLYVGYRCKIYTIIYRENISAWLQHTRNVRIVSY
jgi:hypothetical protein